MARQETGAQLLARLNSRPDLAPLGELLPSCPRYRQVVEFYGTEGTAKTEVLLNILATAVLPSTWQGVKVGGLGVKAILIDNDYKFSIHRLVFVLESRIRSSVDASKKTPSPDSEADQRCHGERDSYHPPCEDASHSFKKDAVASRNGASSMPGEDTRNGRVEPSTCENVAKLLPSGHRRHHSFSPMEVKSGISCDFGDSLEIPTRNLSSETKTEQVAHVGDMGENSDKSNESTVIPHETDSCVDTSQPSQEDVDDLVLQCLQSVFIYHCSSSHQMICTLCSLENVLAASPEIAVLMIDSISAFYFQDRCACEGGSDAVMATLVGILSKLVKEFNLVLFTTKAALMQRQFKDSNKMDPLVRSSEKDAKRSSGSYAYVEYLGRDWNSFVTSRNILTRTQFHSGSVFTITSKAMKASKKFVVTDSGAALCEGSSAVS